MADNASALREMLSGVLAPLIEADGGELYLVSVGRREIQLHLGGSFSGSPAVRETTEQVVKPAVQAVHPKLKLTVTSGYCLPDGAERVKPR